MYLGRPGNLESSRARRKLGEETSRRRQEEERVGGTPSPAAEDSGERLGTCRTAGDGGGDRPSHPCSSPPPRSSSFFLSFFPSLSASPHAGDLRVPR